MEPDRPRMHIRELAEATGIDRRQIDALRRAGKIETYQYTPGGPREVYVDSLYDYCVKHRDHWDARVGALELLAWERFGIELGDTADEDGIDG